MAFLVSGTNSGTQQFFEHLCAWNCSLCREYNGEQEQSSSCGGSQILTWSKSSTLLWLQGLGKELPTPEPVGSSEKVDVRGIVTPLSQNDRSVRDAKYCSPAPHTNPAEGSWA